MNDETHGWGGSRAKTKKNKQTNKQTKNMSIVKKNVRGGHKKHGVENTKR